MREDGRKKKREGGEGKTRANNAPLSASSEGGKKRKEWRGEHQRKSLVCRRRKERENERGRKKGGKEGGENAVLSA